MALHENGSAAGRRADCPGTGSIHAAADVQPCDLLDCDRCSSGPTWSERVMPLARAEHYGVAEPVIDRAVQVLRIKG
nr:hypothetical protein [Micromonospora inyonensis]